ncbi:hypothetical protein G7Y79_00041g077530 [Physcia stellaris]|nr:hypothetical protein G7Y79_00041g077530 [Physcia stellaris]
MPEFKRLHISPLNPELLSIIVPNPVLPLVSNISYHSIQSSPERNYGYVTLPTAEADKIQKKLNGFILRGKKMRVGEARPEKGKRKLENDDAEEVEGSVTKKVRKEKKKSKGEEGVLPGVELPKDRKVKRGWTEPEAPAKSKEKKGKKDKKDKKSKLKPSSYTNEPELLFKTKVPPNAAPLEDETSTSKKKSKKRKKAEQPDRRGEQSTSDQIKSQHKRDSKGSKSTEETHPPTSQSRDPNHRPLNLHKHFAPPNQRRRNILQRHLIRLRTRLRTSHQPHPSSPPQSLSQPLPPTLPSRLSITRSSATPTTTIPTPARNALQTPLHGRERHAPKTQPRNAVHETRSQGEGPAERGADAGYCDAGEELLGVEREGDGDGDVSGPEGMEGYALPVLGEERDGEGEGGKEKGTEESEFAKEFWEKRGERNRAAKRRVREAKKEKRRADSKRRAGRD